MTNFTPASVSVTGGANGTTDTGNPGGVPLPAYGATPGSGGQSITNLNPLLIPGNCYSPTVAHVAEAYAVPMAEGVCLSWATSYEAANLGFQVWRETEKERVLLTRDLVAGSALQVGRDLPLPQGRPYRFLDTTTPTLDAKYWLEDIDLSGQSTWHGPFLVDKKVPPGAGCPTAPTLAELGRLPEGASTPSELLASRAAAAPSVKPTVIPIPSHELGSRPGVKLGVQDAGWYRVTRSQLLAAGLDPSVETANLQLVAEGVEVPILVERANDTTERPAVEAIQFYGFGIDSPSTRTRVFWLVRGTRPGLRLTPEPGPGGLSVATAFPAASERKDRTIFFAALTTNGEAENFFGPLVSTSPVAVSVTTAHLEPRTNIDAELGVRLQGVTEIPHRVDISLNGRLVDTLLFAGRAVGAITIPIPTDLLRDGENTVSLVAAGSALDYSLIDSVRVRYPKAYVADAGALELSLHAGEEARIGHLEDKAPVVVDITNLDTISLVTPRFVDEGGARYLAVGAQEDRTFLAVAAVGRPQPGQRRGKPAVVLVVDAQRSRRGHSHELDDARCRADSAGVPPGHRPAGRGGRRRGRLRRVQLRAEEPVRHPRPGGTVAELADVAFVPAAARGRHPRSQELPRVRGLRLRADQAAADRLHEDGVGRLARRPRG